MPRLTLPSLPRPRFTRRSTGLLVVGLLVLSLGTAATAVTAELRAGVSQASGSAPRVASSVAPSPAPAVTPVARTSAASTKPKHLIDSTLLVTQRAALTHKDLRKLRHVSNALWASVSRGDLTASFDMGHNAKLPLGKDVPVAGHRGVTPIRIGAFASVGMAGVDAVVSAARARQIGLAPRSGVLVSAPKADPLVIRRAVAGLLGKHAHAELLREVVVTRDAGEFLTRVQISGFLHAAASRVGAPYVWGATGPNSFDCSGLVQWSFAQIGIRMPRVAQEQFFAGPHVNYADARPGDLLFWHYDPTDPTYVDHVAIYVGNGQMIEAPHTGDVVKLVPVPLSNMAGVVRVDPALASQIA